MEEKESMAFCVKKNYYIKDTINKTNAEACNFIKKETLAQVFSCEFCEIYKNTFSYRTHPAAAAS